MRHSNSSVAPVDFPVSAVVPVPVAVPPNVRVPVYWKHFVAGTVGGAFGLTLAYPLDTVKIRLQTRGKGAYKGMIDCLTTMVKREGIFSLYRGLLAPVTGAGVINAVAFGTNNYFKSLLASNSHRWRDVPKHKLDGSPTSRLTDGELVIAGAAAGFVQSFVRAPVEQIKTVMQSRNLPGTTKSPYPSTPHAIYHILKTEGVRVGLYRGLSGTLLREVPQYAMYYPIYELSKRYMAKRQNKSVSELESAQVLLAGGVAGVSQWVPTYPIDVVKSHLHAAPPGTYRGFVDAARRLYTTEGSSVFLRGFHVCLIRSFPLHAAIFFGYETTLSFLGPD